MNKYEKILEETWYFLENTYKSSEITIDLCLDIIKKKSDTKNCLKMCVKQLWSMWEWDTCEEKYYWEEYIFNSYGIVVK